MRSQCTSDEERAITVVYGGREPPTGNETAAQLGRADDRLTVRPVTSPDDGQQLLAESDVDCIVSVQQLPERTGIEFLRSVRADDPELPFLLSPAAGSERLAADAVSAGVTDYICSDDTGVGELAERIIEAVDQYRAAREAKATQHAENRERAIRASVLRAQQEAVIDGILVVNEHDEIITYNDRFIEMWDIPDEIVEMSDRAALNRTREMVVDSASFVEEVRELYDNPTETSRDEVELTDGRVFERYSAPVTGEDGTHYGRLWTYRDITEHKRRERELERYETILQSIEDITFVVDEGQRVVSVNETLARKFGIPEQRVVGQSLETLSGEFLANHETPGKLRAAIERIFEGDHDTTRSERVEIAVAFPDGEYVFEYHLSPVITDGETTEVVVVMRDITDRNQREQPLREAKNRLILSSPTFRLSCSLSTTTGCSRSRKGKGWTDSVSNPAKSSGCLSTTSTTTSRILSRPSKRRSTVNARDTSKTWMAATTILSISQSSKTTAPSRASSVSRSISPSDASTNNSSNNKTSS